MGLIEKARRGIVPHMETVRSDDRSRIVLKAGGPKRVFQVEQRDPETWVITRLAPPAEPHSAARLRRRNGRLVGTVGRVVTHKELEPFLDEWP